MLLKKKDDGKIYRAALESLGDADREYVRQHTAGDKRAASPAQEANPAASVPPPGPSAQNGRAGKAASVSLAGGKQASHTALPEAKEVVVTGDGADADKALQNAFSQAIEQAVGVLVDAETVVKNDQLIRDEVLTYSRGYVEKYEVVKRWQEDGLHRATIQAVVARTSSPRSSEG